MELNLGFADRYVPVLEELGDGIESVGEIEVDERTLAVLQLVDDRRFFELALEIGELTVIPDLPEAE